MLLPCLFRSRSNYRSESRDQIVGPLASYTTIGSPMSITRIGILPGVMSSHLPNRKDT